MHTASPFERQPAVGPLAVVRALASCLSLASALPSTSGPTLASAWILTARPVMAAPAPDVPARVTGRACEHGSVYAWIAVDTDLDGREDGRFEAWAAPGQRFVLEGVPPGTHDVVMELDDGTAHRWTLTLDDRDLRLEPCPHPGPAIALAPEPATRRSTTSAASHPASRAPCAPSPWWRALPWWRAGGDGASDPRF